MIRWLPDEPIQQTARSIAEAKAARDRERAAFTQTTGREVDDDGRLGLRLANAIWSAVNSTEGQAAEDDSGTIVAHTITVKAR